MKLLFIIVVIAGLIFVGCSQSVSEVVSDNTLGGNITLQWAKGNNDFPIIIRYKLSDNQSWFGNMPDNITRGCTFYSTAFSKLDNDCP